MKRIFIAILFVISALSLKAQGDMVHERLYLSTDKTCYLAGEDIWISAFCYDAASGIYSPISAVAYLELQNLSGSLVQSKIALNHGRGNGFIHLPVSLPTGIYRLTGYTRYMYSESRDNFFSGFVTVYNPLTTLRSENVRSRTAADSQITMPAPEENISRSAFALTTDKKNYHTKENVRITFRNPLPETFSASISVFRLDDLSFYGNRSIVEIIDSTRNESLKPFPLDKVDYAGEIIRGYVVDEDNVPVTNVESFGSYISIAGKDIQYFTGEIRDSGKVRFFTSNLYGDGTLVSYVPSFNHKKYHLVLDSVYMHPQVDWVPQLILDRNLEEVLLERSLGVQIAQAYRMDTLAVEKRLPANLLFENTGIVYKLDEYTRFPTMGEVLIEFIREARFKSEDGTHKLQVRLRDATGIAYYLQDPTPPLVLLDGIPIEDHEKIYNYDPNLVKEIIIHTDRYAFGSIYYNGIIFFRTFKGDFPGLDLDESMRIQEFRGVQNPRSLAVVPADSRLPDLRHTLYWNPQLEVKPDESVTLNAITSETTGTFRVVIQGLDMKGNPFSTSTDFTVK
ncbi:MAG: hypothetical protein RBR31_04270 [Bacteroidales bacterium]|nr:hypothetical protein [Bacteroidales bacterium]